MDVSIKSFWSLFWILACNAAIQPQAMANTSASIMQNAAGIHSAGTAVRPAYLRAIKSRLATPAAKIGNLYQSPFCVPHGDLLWDKPLFREISYRLPKIFRRELQRVRYPVPALSASFDRLGEADAIQYLEIDMSIEQASADVCLQEDGLSGWASIRVHWQVYDAGKPISMHETVTEGMYRSAMVENTTIAQMFEKAFSIAAKNFLANSGFHQAADHAQSH